MKRYAIYDSIKNGDSFNEFIDAKNEEEALKIAENAWNHMSEHDRKARSTFDLAFVESEDPDDEDYKDIPESDYTPIKSWVVH